MKTGTVEIHLALGTQLYRADLASVVDLSIPVRFDATQVRAFGAPNATAQTYRSGTFTGDVRQGGSCNCVTLHLTPHCNGTHTESVAHLTGEPYAVTQLATGMYLAQLVSVQPDHQVITLAQLQQQLTDLQNVSALIVRTLPNTNDKFIHDYDTAPPPASFEPAALAWLNKMGIEHLLVDLPSVDPMADGGVLAAHRAFWGLPTGSHSLHEAQRPHATITELIFVPDQVIDGRYLLNLNIAPIASDAAPSRPLIYRVQQ